MLPNIPAWDFQARYSLAEKLLVCVAASSRLLSSSLLCSRLLLLLPVCMVRQQSSTMPSIQHMQETKNQVNYIGNTSAQLGLGRPGMFFGFHKRKQNLAISMSVCLWGWNIGKPCNTHCKGVF